MSEDADRTRAGWYALVALVVLIPLAVLFYLALAADTDPLERETTPAPAGSRAATTPAGSGPGAQNEREVEIAKSPRRETPPIPAAAETAAPAANGWALSGRVVVRGTGEPVAGALVDLLPVDGPSRERPSPLGQTVTNGEGGFRFDPVPAKEPVRLEASAAGFVAARSATLTARPQPEVVLYLERGAVLEGRVVRSSDGAGLEGARVTARIEALPPRGLPVGARSPAANGPEWNTATDPEGAFRLEGVAPGRVVVEAGKTGFADGRLAGVLVAAGQTRSGLVITLGRGGTFRGTVRYPDGRPAPGVRVVAVDARNFRYVGCTSKDGRFELVRMRPGRYAIQLLEPGRPEEVTWVRDVDRPRAASVPGDRILDLVEGARIDRDFTIPHGCAVQGTVVAGDAPVAGARVVLKPLPLPGRNPPAAPVRAVAFTTSAVTDAGGRFLLPHVIPGAFEVTVRVQGDRLSYVALTRTETIPAGDDHRLDLVLPHASIGGRIRKPDGVASRCILRLRRTDGQRPHVRSQAERDDGTYRFDHLESGTYEIVVTAGPDSLLAAVSRRNIVVGPDAQISDVDFFLSAGETLTGHVVDEGGRPVAGARIRAVPEEEEARRLNPPVRGRSGPDGRFTLSRLRPGRYQVRAVKRRDMSEALTVVVVPGNPADAGRLVLRPQIR